MNINSKIQYLSIFFGNVFSSHKLLDNNEQYNNLRIRGRKCVEENYRQLNIHLIRLTC